MDSYTRKIVFHNAKKSISGTTATPVDDGLNVFPGANYLDIARWTPLTISSPPPISQISLIECGRSMTNSQANTYYS
jgi:hypothetical protein